MITDEDFLTVFPRDRDPLKNPRTADVVQSSSGEVAAVRATFGLDPPMVTVADMRSGERHVFTPSTWRRFGKGGRVLHRAEETFDAELKAMHERLR